MQKFQIPINTQTKFLLSTSGSNSSIKKHNKALQSLDINLCYFTFSGEISAENYANAIKAPFIQGAAVTAQGGLKSNIVPYLDYIEPLAQQTLAVNTVINRDGKLYGYNTDAFGLQTALTNGITNSNHKIKTAVIYGNGGVSGVAFKVLQDLGIKVTIIGRNPDKVAQKRKKLGIENIPHFSAPYDLIIDATPISSSPKLLENKQFIELVNSAKVVFCHNMPEKDGKRNYLLDYCNEKSIFYIAGKDMYVAQLLKQYSLYFENLDKNISEADIIKAWQLDENK